MGQISRSKVKRDWAPTALAFRRFLDWLDEGHDSKGERYLEMRQRLVRYFDHKRCVAADDLADETLNRVVRRIEEEGAITDATPAPVIRPGSLVSNDEVRGHRPANAVRQMRVCSLLLRML
jgi:hypothetical protein